MKLIVGLGNPGNLYRFTRHNMGFLVLEALATTLGAAVGQKGFQALYGRGIIETVPVLMAKPQTFMNRSGEAVRRLLDYFKIALDDLIVIHDDLDFPFGMIRLKAGGGSGGHKGLTSLVEHLGSEEFIRVRLGIGKPAYKGMVEDYVLEPLPAEELQSLPDIVTKAADAVIDIVQSGMSAAMNKCHGPTEKNAS